MRVALLGAAHIHITDFLIRLNAHPSITTIGLFEENADCNAAARRMLTKPVEALAPDALNGYDVAVIASETYRHAEYLEAAVAAKLALFVEKPMLLDDSPARDMAAVIIKNGRPFHTGYFYREIPAIHAVRQMIGDGALGKLHSITLHITHDGVNKGWFAGYEWMLDPRKAGYGGFGDLGLHAVDLICWLAEAADPALFSHQPTFDAVLRGSDSEIMRPSENEPEYTGTGTITFANGMIGNLTAGWREADPPFLLHVQGSRGEIRIDSDQRYSVIDGVRTPLNDAFSPDSGDGLTALLDYMVTPHGRLVDAATAIHRGQFMHALYRSAMPVA